MSKQVVLQKTIDEQQKVIKYLQTKYKENTGRDIDLPQTWKQFLSIEEKEEPIIGTDIAIDQKYAKKTEEISEKKEETFLQVVSMLDLPSKLKDPRGKSSYASTSERVDKGSIAKKRGTMTTNFNPKNPNHMIEYLDLSNFKHKVNYFYNNLKKFTKAGFKDLVESVVDMRCLTTVIFKNNGIDDSYIDEIGNFFKLLLKELLFSNISITRIDLSENEIDKKGAIQIGKFLKEINHLEWIDLSRNNFSHDHIAVSSIISGLRQQKHLFHFGLDANLPPYNPNIRSMSLIDSKITKDAITNIRKALTGGNNHIIGLNLKYCYLNTFSIFTLCQSIEANRTLVKLDLSSNGLSSNLGIAVVTILKNNLTLNDLNLSKNNLGDSFACDLADVLKVNEVLWRVDISNNPIANYGAERILEALQERNDTIESLGNITLNTQMGIINIQKINRALRENQANKTIKSKLIEESRARKGADPMKLDIPGNTAKEEDNFNQQNYLEEEYSNYKLLKPVLFTNFGNSENKDLSLNFRPWNIY